MALPVLGVTEWFLNLLARHGMSVGIAILLLIGGFPLTRWLAGRVISGWAKQGLDPSLHHFLRALLLWTMRVGLLLMVGAMAGLEVTAFVAMLGGFAFAVGLALQGHLSNFAGGILIIVLRPFRVGDLVETQGHTGLVAGIHVFNTYLKTTDNRTVIIPNGPLSNGVVVNYTLEKTRRVDMSAGIAYGSDVETARRAVLAFMAGNALILKAPAPEVHVGALADFSVNLVIRCWALTPDYWSVFYGLQEGVKKALDAAGVEIPFPQRVVHMVPPKER